jgi:predicted nucleic acid-binding protein
MGPGRRAGGAGSTDDGGVRLSFRTKVNALIALLDEEHVHHEAILEWLTGQENLGHGFATCAITQIGLIRVMSSKGYFKPVATQEGGHPARSHDGKGHQYLGMPAPTAVGAIRWRDVKSASSTDALLLSTAVAYGCRLVTFDSSQVRYWREGGAPGAAWVASSVAGFAHDRTGRTTARFPPRRER